jgi:7-carboxy-7-deazaguanine synthase
MPGKYAVKEMFLTLQGEGVQAGRRAVFCRFAGCNLWSGREADRASAICQFCDTDFVGTDGEHGGRYAAAELAARAVALWGPGAAGRYIVLTGGEPLLQVDAALIDALHVAGFTIAVESNGTIAVPAGIDWVCISPKAGSALVQRVGDELKLVWPQADIDLDLLAGLNFTHHLIQPKDVADPAARAANVQAAITLVMARPQWRLTLQDHKTLGLA